MTHGGVPLAYAKLTSTECCSEAARGYRATLQRAAKVRIESGFWPTLMRTRLIGGKPWVRSLPGAPHRNRTSTTAISKNCLRNSNPADLMLVDLWQALPNHLDSTESHSARTSTSRPLQGILSLPDGRTGDASQQSQRVKIETEPPDPVHAIVLLVEGNRQSRRHP